MQDWKQKAHFSTARCRDWLAASLEETGAERGSLWLFNSDDWKLAAQEPLESVDMGKTAPLPPVLVKNAVQAKQVLAADSDAPAKGFVCCAPLVFQDETLGALCLTWPSLGEDRKHLIREKMHQFARTLSLEIQGLHLQVRLQDSNLALNRMTAEKKRLESQLRLETEALRQSEERWQHAVEGSQDGVWDWKIKSGEVFYSARWKEILGYQDHELPNTMEVWEERVHPGDLSRVQADIQKNLTGETEIYQSEYRMFAKDGTIRWILARGKSIFNNRGEPIRMSGSHTDITDRNFAEERFRILFEHSSDANILYNGNGIIDCNNAALKVLGLKHKQQIIGRLPAALSPKIQPDGQASIEKGKRMHNLAKKNGHHIFVWSHRRAGGTSFPVEVALTPVAFGNRPAMMAVFHDISERVRIEKLRSSQTQILEMITSGASLSTIFEALIKDVEAQAPQFRCFILLAEETRNQLKLAALSNMPDSWITGAKGLKWHSQQEPCGKAARQGRRAICADFETAGKPEPLARLCLEQGFRACWAEPIPDQSKGVLGTFNVLLEKPGRPDVREIELLRLAAKLIGVAVSRRRIEDGLRKAKEAAEIANRSKSQFLSNMSHELRTPLNAILGFSQLMSRDRNLSAEHVENLNVINRSGEHLLAIINDILEMSKIEAGGVELYEEAFDLFHLLSDLEQMFQLRAQRKGLLLLFQRDEEVPRFLVSDQGKIRQIFINLLSNAIKFTEKGSITVQCSCKSPPGQRDQLHLSFQVKDTGTGIAEEEMENLFSPFVQAESGRRSQMGTGLGLAICREFVALLGGELSVKSQLGVGSVFRFHVKVAPAHQAERVNERGDEKVIGLESGQQDWRILVVEDQTVNRALLVTLLKQIGLNVREAGNGKEAVDLALDWKPHLIFMDKRMPVMDGMEATRLIKAGFENQSAPVIIALTASAFAEDRDLLLEAGCDDFVSKPFRERELFNKIKKHLGARFTYEKSDLEKIDRNHLKSGPFTAKDLSPIPPTLLDNLEKATILGDLENLQEQIEAISRHHETLAAYLSQLFDRFAYDDILKLLRGRENYDSQPCDERR